MSQTYQCGETASLVGYLYAECDPAERESIEAHVAICSACTAELAALQSTRACLAAWVPPEAGLGFQIVRPAESVAAPTPLAPDPSPHVVTTRPWYARPIPVWAQAMAATVLFASGLALGVMRGTAPVSAPAPSAGLPVTASGVSASDLAALEERLRAEMAQVRPAATDAADPIVPTVSEAQLLARVRTLIEESEQRQQRELAKQTAQVMRDFDSQRKVDLARIEQSFGQIEGLTGAEVRQQRQMLDYLIRASERR